MSGQPNGILKRNFLLKRVGDELYLPCETLIAIKAPLLMPKAAYILCQTAAFDAASGLLSLNAPTDYILWDATAFAISKETNSAAIIAAGVTGFIILHGTQSIIDSPPKFDWKLPANADDWLPIPSPPSEAAYPTAKKTPGLPGPLPLSINEKCAIAIQALTFDKGVIRFTRFVSSQNRRNYLCHRPSRKR